MGQVNASGAAGGVSPFAAPPYVMTVDELVAHWVGHDAELREQQQQQQQQQQHQHRNHDAEEEEGQQQSRRTSGIGSSTRQRRRSSSTGGSAFEEGHLSLGMRGTRALSAAVAPSVALVTVRRRDGLEVVVCRDVAYGARIQLPPLLEDEEVIVAFSDGSMARLPASAVRAQAGMGDALYTLDQAQRQQREHEQEHRHQLICRVEQRQQHQEVEEEGEGGRQLGAYDPTGGAAGLLPLQLAGEREVQLAAVLVNMACHHHSSLTGVTLLLLGLLVFAEAYKRHVAQGMTQREGQRALQAAAAGLELVAERCMRRRRSSVVEMVNAHRTRTMTMATLTTTTTVTTTTTTTVVMVEEADAEGAGQQTAVASVTRRATRSASSAAATALLAVASTVEEEEVGGSSLSSSSRRGSALIVMRPEDLLPGRYLVVCGHDVAKAQAMWAATLQWRETYGADAILERPHTKFHTVKAFFPQFLAGRSKSGFPGELRPLEGGIGWMDGQGRGTE
jgi:hypothetical protein